MSLSFESMELRIFSDPHKHVTYKGAEITGLVCAVSPASGIRPGR